jgi:hypothetical protein
MTFILHCYYLFQQECRMYAIGVLRKTYDCPHEHIGFRKILPFVAKKKVTSRALFAALLFDEVVIS